MEMLEFDFGENKRSEPRVFGVTELTREVRRLLEDHFGEIWVEGEISNFRRQSSGHCYFTLKDAESQIACVLFRGQAAMVRGVELVDGRQVQVSGELTVYEARGQYQIIVRKVQARGEGALQAKFEALKRKLEAEGLFASERKRSLPLFPRRIGVVTSPTGAALRDFLKVLRRRVPVEVLLCPVRVQGAGAAAEIAAGIRMFAARDQNGLPLVDAIAVIRGGGSMEDLWEFNEEIVARAIAESPVPVVTGVGHEIDFTIADFAADVRMPTPSAAAAALSPDADECARRVAVLFNRLDRARGAQMREARMRLEVLARSAIFREPERRIAEYRMQIDRAEERMSAALRGEIDERRHQLAEALGTLRAASPAAKLEKARRQLMESRAALIKRTELLLQEWRGVLNTRQAKLQALSPRETLLRGYTITLGEDGRALASAKSALSQKTLRTVFADGEVESHPVQPSISQE